MITIYSKTNCPYCDLAKKYLLERDIPFTEVNIMEDSAALEFIKSKGHKTVPQIYYDDELFVEGGWTGLSEMGEDNLREKLITLIAKDQ